MQTWKISKLGEYSNVIAGQSPKGEFYNNLGKGIPFYQGKKEFTDKFIGAPSTWTTSLTKEAIEGDILMSVRAPVGPVNISTQRICIGRGLAAIRVSENLNRDYLFYYLSHIQNKLSGNSGAVFDSINKAQIENIQVPIPPLPEQQRIVDILGQSFAAIDQAIENTEKNLINAKDLFLSALDQLFSNYAKTSPDRFIGDVSNVIAGQSPEGKYYNNNGIGLPFYQGKKEFTDKFLDKPTTWTTKITKEALENDILMSVRAPVGPVNIATEKICIGRGLSAIRPSKYILRDYLFYFFISNKEKLVGNSGTVFNSINKTQIEKIPIPVPPINKQHEFVNLVALLSNRVQNLDSVYSKKKNLLIELKQSILHKAFNGELS